MDFVQVGAPAALAVTGENGGDDLATTLVSGGIVAVLYLFVIPVREIFTLSYIEDGVLMFLVLVIC